MRFSVVVPTYNRAHLIEETLDSLFSQEFGDFEILVVDNKSTDNTVEVLVPYVADGRIRLLVNEKNHERAYSRQRGMTAATGEYITFLDSDDFLYPDCLSLADQYASAHPDLKLFHAPYELVDQTRRPIHSYSLPSLTDPKLAMSKGNFLSNISVFYRRDLTQEVAWDDDPILSGVEDYDFVLRAVALAGPVGRIGTRPLSGIREHPERSVSLDQIDIAQRRTDHFIEKLRTDPVYQTHYSAHLPRIRATLYQYLAYMGRLVGNRSAITKYLKAARRASLSVLGTKAYWSLQFAALGIRK